MTNQQLFVYQSPANLESVARAIIATPPEQSEPLVTITYPRNSDGCSFERLSGPKNDVFAVVAYIVAHDKAEYDYMYETIDHYAESGDNAVVILSRCHTVR